MNNMTSQYNIWQILGIWGSVALPMGLVYWVIIPVLLARGNDYPFTYFLLIVAALIWQGVVAYILLRREVRPFTWQSVKDRLWLHAPSNPRTGVRSKWLLLWTIPLSVLAFFVFPSLGWLNQLWTEAIPFLTQRPYAVLQNLAGPAEGQWWLLGVFFVDAAFNYLLGEELIFRGILLPKMNGAFGKWDWLANHILFAAYHLHSLSTTPSRLIFNWVFPFTTKQFKSYWMGAIVHGSDAIFLTYMFILAIKGLV
jgi:membrane protease YdiL (CAAX protease family)